jgi:hypothetical protein
MNSQRTTVTNPMWRPWPSRFIRRELIVVEDRVGRVGRRSLGDHLASWSIILPHVWSIRPERVRAVGIMTNFGADGATRLPGLLGNLRRRGIGHGIAHVASS